jgi:putative NADH-flavin reductase
MNLTVFGASGRTGRPLVQQALDAGHHVTAFVRSPAKLTIQHANLTVVQGDVTDGTAVARAITPDTDAVLVALGHVKGAPDDVLTVGTRHILDAMQAAGVTRIVNVTGGGVAYPKDPPFLPSKIVRGIMRVVAGKLLADSERQRDLLTASGMEWTNVRGPRLTEGPLTENYQAGYLKLGPVSVSRADVAHFMLHCAEDEAFVREAPHLAPAKNDA